MTSAPAWAYQARTAHARFAPVRRQFAYRLFSLFVDIDRVAAAQTRLFSYNRTNLFSFMDKDHGDRSGAPLRAWCERTFARAGVDLDGGEIRLLALPRVLGFVFNPLSVFFGYDRAGALVGIIYEVNNTFGETHSYAFAVDDRQGQQRHVAQKRFHVSPFFDVRGRYEFVLPAPGETLALTIENWTGETLEHRASLTGARAPLDDRRLLRAFFALPFMTIGVVAAIHWQALKIWAAGIAYRPKPKAPIDQVSACPLARDIAIPTSKALEYNVRHG
jgi:DUF1365 family protein